MAFAGQTGTTRRYRWKLNVRGNKTRLILTLNLQTQNGASTVQTLYNTRVVVSFHFIAAFVFNLFIFLQDNPR